MYDYALGQNLAVIFLTFFSFGERKVFFCTDTRDVPNDSLPRIRHHGEP